MKNNNTLSKTIQQLIELVSAVALLERNGKRFCVDYGYENAVELSKKLKLR